MTDLCYNCLACHLPNPCPQKLAQCGICYAWGHQLLFCPRGMFHVPIPFDLYTSYLSLGVHKRLPDYNYFGSCSLAMPETNLIKADIQQLCARTAAAGIYLCLAPRNCTYARNAQILDTWNITALSTPPRPKSSYNQGCSPPRTKPRNHRHQPRESCLMVSRDYKLPFCLVARVANVTRNRHHYSHQTRRREPSIRHAGTRTSSVPDHRVHGRALPCKPDSAPSDRKC